MSTALFLIVLFGSLLGLGIALGLAFQRAGEAMIRHYEIKDAFERASWMRRNVGSGYTEEQADEARRQAESLVAAELEKGEE